MIVDEIRSRLKSDDEEVRRSVLHMLEGVPLNESLGIIFCAMGDDSWRVRKESVEAFANAQPDESSIEKLLELLRNEENAGLRNSAAEAVIRNGAIAIQPLIKMVTDPDADVRKFVVDLMGAIKNPLFVKPLLNALTDPDVNVSAAAAEHLGSSGDPGVIPDLLRAIVANQAVLFRFSALGALSTLAEPSPVPVDVLRLADQVILRKAVYDCLGSIADDKSLPILLDGFYSQQKGSRSAALKAIFRIYSRSEVTARHEIEDELRSLNGKDVIPALLNLFDSQDALLVEALIWCSVATGDSRFVPILIESFEDERFTESALKSLKNFGSAGISNVVAQHASANENVRCAVCTLIGECGYSEYADLIGAAFNDQSPRVRKAAITAAGKIGLNSLIPDLVRLADDMDETVSTSAVSSLQGLALNCRPEILKIARQFSASESPRHRRYASHLYASLGEHERLLLLAKDENPLVREAAVSAIGNLRLKSSGTILVMALVDEDPDVRIAAADALGNINENASLDALEHALEDEDTWVRCAVLRAIARIDRERVLAIIKRVHTEAEGLFMITCLQILEADCGFDAQSIIRLALTNPDPDIARQASMSLEHCFSEK